MIISFLSFFFPSFIIIKYFFSSVYIIFHTHTHREKTWCYTILTQGKKRYNHKTDFYWENYVSPLLVMTGDSYSLFPFLFWEVKFLSHNACDMNNICQALYFLQESMWKQTKWTNIGLATILTQVERKIGQ